MEDWTDVFRNKQQALFNLLCATGLKDPVEDELPAQKNLEKNVGKLMKSLPLRAFSSNPRDYGFTAKDQISALQEVVQDYVNVRRQPEQRLAPESSFQGTDIFKLLSQTSKSERTETIDFNGSTVKKSTFAAIQAGSFVSTAELNSNRVHTVVQNQVKKKNPLYVPSDSQEFLEWLRLIIDIVKEADFTNFLYLPTSDYEDKEDFCSKMDAYYKIMAKTAKGVTASTLFAVDNYVRQRQASLGLSWTNWSTETSMGVFSQLRNAVAFAPMCNICSSIHCQESSCPFMKSKEKTSLVRPGAGRATPLKPNQKKKCNLFESSGGCRYGDKCKFVHSKRQSPRLNSPANKKKDD